MLHTRRDSVSPCKQPTVILAQRPPLLFLFAVPFREANEDSVGLGSQTAWRDEGGEGEEEEEEEEGKQRG